MWRVNEDELIDVSIRDFWDTIKLKPSNSVEMNDIHKFHEWVKLVFFDTFNDNLITPHTDGETKYFDKSQDLLKRIWENRHTDMDKSGISYEVMEILRNICMEKKCNHLAFNRPR